MAVGDWADMCPDTVVWERKTGRDAYGKPSYAAGVEYSGRREYKVSRVAGRAPVDGAAPEVVSNSRVYILAFPDVGYEDRVYVLGDAPPYPPVVNVERHRDEAGDHHVVVMLGGV